MCFIRLSQILTDIQASQVGKFFLDTLYMPAESEIGENLEYLLGGTIL